MLRGRLLDGSAPEFERIALSSLMGRGLLSHEEELQCLRQLLRDPLPALRIAAVRHSPKLMSNNVPVVLLDGWQAYSADERDAVCSAILQMGAARLLVEQLELQRIQPKSLSLSIVAQLRNHFEQDIRQRAEQVFGKASPRAPLVAKYLREFPNDVSPETAQLAGRQLFVELCSVCHQPKQGSPALGPAIENLGHWSNEQWITAIIDPNQAVEPKFQQQTLLTVSGQVITGIPLERSSQSIKLATPDGQTREIELAEIEEQQTSPISLMPEGMEEKLTPQQLAELIHYLRSR